MYSSVSVDGFIADENDQPGPLLTGCSAVMSRWTRAASEGVADSYDYTRPYWDQIGGRPSLAATSST